MADQQLQMEPIEENPIVDLDDVPAQEENVGYDVSPTLSTDSVGGLRPGRPQLEGAAGLYNVAALDMAVTPDNVEESLLALRPSTQVQSLLAGLRTEDEEIRKLSAVDLLQNPQISVTDKIGAIALLQDDSKIPDYNTVQRNVAHNMANYDWQRDDEEDGDDWLVEASSRAEAMPKDVSPFDESIAPKEQQEKDVWSELQQMYNAANEHAGLLDYAEQITPIGSLPTLNRAVSRIYSDLGIKGGFETGLSYAAVGTALQDLRNTYRQGTPEQKEQIARVVMNALKQDTGLLQDSNDLVTAQVLDNLFSKELTGEDAYAFETGAPAEVDAQIEQLTDRMYKETQPRSPERAELQEAINQLRKSKTGFGPGSVFDNSMNLLDLVGVGQVGRTGLSLGKKFLPAAWKRLFAASPRAGAERAADAVQRGDVAAQMGVDGKVALEQGLPNAGHVERGVNVLDALAERQKQALQVALRQAQPVNYTASERAAALAELNDEIGALVGKKLPAAHINLTSVIERADGSGADIEAVFGATPHRGYARLDGARKGAQAMVEEVFGADAPYEIVRWDNGKQAFEAVPAGTSSKTKGEFFIRATDSRSYASAKETFGRLNIGDDSVADLTLGASVSRWTRGINVFDNELQGWISHRARSAVAAEGLGSGLMKPIASLPHQEKQWLAGIMRKYEGKQVLTEAELRQEGANDAMVEAYRSFRAIDDATYDLVDGHLRNLYAREGMKDVRAAGVRQGWAKPVENLNRASVADAHVFDPETGSIVKMSAADVEKLYNAGGQVGRLKFPIEAAKARATHILLSGKNTRVLPIPQRGVLPRIVGHYPHITQGNYIVYGVTHNGERVALKMAATASDAAEYVARRGAIQKSRLGKGKSNRFASMHFEYDKSLQHPESWGQKFDEVFTNNGGILFGQRSDAYLGNLSKDFGDINVDPIQSLLTGWGVATQTVTKGELIASMKQRLYNFMKKPENRNLFVDPDTPAQYLSSRNVNKSFTNVKARDTALAYAKQIELMEHTPDQWRNATREAYRRASYVAFKLGQKPLIQKTGLKQPLRKLEKALLTKARTGANAVNAAMSYMHAIYIAMAAPKQFVLQAMQSLYAAGYSPTGYAKAVQQATAIMGGVMGQMKTLHGGASVWSRAELVNIATKSASKFGMKPKEMISLIDTIVESGLIDAVQHNTMIKEAIGDAAKKQLLNNASSAEQSFGQIGRALGVAGNIARWPVQKLSEIGFQGGENINQIMSFLTLYNADKAKGVADLASHAYKDSLIGRVSELTGNMISPAAPEYTRSFLKPFFQWIQFQHKMVLMTLPERLGGSSMFSGAEKARMAAVQMLLYGTQATAISAVAQQAIERGVVEKLAGDDPNNEFVQFWRSESTKAVLDGFLFDYTANKALQAIYGESDKEWRDFSWGKSFAPGAGSEFLSERIIGLATLDKQAMFGVLGRQTSKLAQFAERAWTVAQGQWQGVDDVPFERRAEQLTKQGLASTIPMYDKYLAFKWAQANDERISQGGRISEGFSNDMEVVMQGVFGVTTKEQTSYYDAMDRLGAKYAQGTDDELQSIADKYWKTLIAESVKWDNQTVDDSLYDTLLSNWTNEQALVLSALGRRDKERVNELISAKLEAVASGEATDADDAETAFVRKFATKLASGGFGDEGPSLAAYMSDLPFVKNNPERAVLIQQAWEEVAEEPTPQNLTTNEIGN